jgi:predicted chitinase
MRAHEFVTERKKRRRKKPRWAAYGPGPYGGYGYAVGYSGDSSAGDSEVGEASYDGNIGAMEVFKFMNTASSFEKDLLKKLIAQKSYAKAWALVQGVTGIKLKGKEFEVEEGWRDTLAGLALGAGVALGGPASANVEKVEVSKGDTVYSIAKAFGTSPQTIQKLNKLDKNFSIKPGQTIKVPAGEVIDVIKEPSKEKKAELPKKKQAKPDTSKTLTGTTHEAVLTRTARAAGITNPIELAAFLAQCAHESHDFQSMVEYGGSLDFRKYDPKYAPKKARALGNKKVGDGARYKGRGYIQLTGRYNYKRAGEALNLPLEQKPQLAEKPEVAAKIAVWFWKQRVQPNVDNFNDVRAVTKPINPGLNGLEDRREAFIDFKKFKLASK